MVRLHRAEAVRVISGKRGVSRAVEVQRAGSVTVLMVLGAEGS